MEFNDTGKGESLKAFKVKFVFFWWIGMLAIDSSSRGTSLAK